MLASLDSDKHNFGQTVRLMERASGLWFRKPRPVFWEYLFFGKTSPLKKYFSEPNATGRSLDKYLFNLEVEIEAEWIGHSRGVPRAQDVSVSEEHFYAFGVLLGYSFLFGIRDLHRHNLILTPTHMQVIDAEVVLTNLTLPHETVLLPFKDIGFETCGASLIANSIREISQAQRRELFRGYFDLFAVAFKNHTEILQELKSVVDATPVRVILRNTREYTKHLNGHSLIKDLLNEERVQLARGDIPYFFKRLGKRDLFWISSEDGAALPVDGLGVFQADIDRHALLPETLLRNKDIIEKKMVQGAFLLQKLLVDDTEYEFQWNHKPIRFNLSGLTNESTGRQFLKASPS